MPSKVEAWPPKNLLTNANSPNVSANSAGSRPGSSINSRAVLRESKSSVGGALMAGRERLPPW